MALGAGEAGGDVEPGIHLAPGAGLRCPDRGPGCDRHSLPEPRLLCENQSEDAGLGDALRDLAPGGKWRFGS